MKPRHPGPFAENMRYAMTRLSLTSGGLERCLDLKAVWYIEERRIRRLASGATRPVLIEIPILAKCLKVEPQDLAWLDPVAFQALYP